MAVKQEDISSHSSDSLLTDAVERCLRADTDGSERYDTEVLLTVTRHAAKLVPEISASEYLTQERARRAHPLQAAVDRALFFLDQVYSEELAKRKEVAGLVDPAAELVNALQDPKVLTPEAQANAQKPYILADIEMAL